jgi:hypothetical protein
VVDQVADLVETLIRERLSKDQLLRLKLSTRHTLRAAAVTLPHFVESAE